MKMKEWNIQPSQFARAPFNPLRVLWETNMPVPITNKTSTILTHGWWPIILRESFAIETSSSRGSSEKFSWQGSIYMISKCWLHYCTSILKPVYSYITWLSGLSMLQLRFIEELERRFETHFFLVNSPGNPCGNRLQNGTFARDNWHCAQ